MFGTSGIRGPVGERITAATALNVGRALASRGATRVVVGRDPRDSGRALADAASAGLRECGADVVRLGVVSTPTLARSVDGLEADAGVAVTGSHNPPRDNGIKLWTPSGRAFDREQRRQVTRYVKDDTYAFARWDGHGEEWRVEDAANRHRARLVDAHDPVDDLSVAVDVGNGAGRITADTLDQLGCTVRTVNAQADGAFPGRKSEPTASSCEPLCRFVAATDADLGVAHDGDADRMMAVTGDGEFVPGDSLLAAFAREGVSSGDAVAVPVNTSLVVDDVVGDAGGSVVRTKVGDVFVAERAAEDGVVFGGEPSGAWIWPDETLCPDGPLAACRLAALVDEHGEMASLLPDAGDYHLRRESIAVEDKRETMDRVCDGVAARYETADRTDGVRIGVDGGWFLIRASGTEPIVRITAEARDAERVDEIFEEASATVERAAVTS